MSTFVYKNDQQFGPYEDSEIMRRLGSGEFSRDDYCWQSGWDEWKPLRLIFPNPPTVTTSNRKPLQECKPYAGLMAEKPKPEHLRTDRKQSSRSTYSEIVNYEIKKKSTAVAYILWWLGGWIGAHAIYLKRPRRYSRIIFFLLIFILLGSLHFLAISHNRLDVSFSALGIEICFIIIMLAWWVIDAFCIPRWVREYNLGLHDRPVELMEIHTPPKEINEGGIIFTVGIIVTVLFIAVMAAIIIVVWK